MAEEKNEPWLNYLALATVVLAVCATLSTFKGGSYSTRSVLSQSQAANQWAFYQAKSIKGYLYEVQKEKLELELKGMDAGTSKQLARAYEQKIAFYAENLKRYNEEKAEIQKGAQKFENQLADSQRHAQIFGIALIFLQIAILLSSIAALLKKKTVWMIGLALGLLGVAYFINGFFLYLPAGLYMF